MKLSDRDYLLTHISEMERAKIADDIKQGYTYLCYKAACGALFASDIEPCTAPTCPECLRLYKEAVEIRARKDEARESKEQVNSPAHYNAGKVEVIDMIESAVAPLGPRAFEAYCAGNVLKYVSRFSKKGGKTDLQKAAWYLSRLIDRQP